MSETSKSVQGDSSMPTYAKTETKEPQDVTTDPFNTPFDDENEDAWWNEEESPESILENPTAGSRMTQWPKAASHRVGSNTKTTQRSLRKPVKRHSVYKPTREKSRQRQKKQNAAAGIRIITNFSRHNGPPPAIQQTSMLVQPSRTIPQAGCFVDLAALQALDDHISNAPTSLWKSMQATKANKTVPLEAKDGPAAEISHSLDVSKTAEAVPERLGSRRGQGRLPSPLKLGADLSPCDRPIVIGISIPSAKMAEHITSPDTASPETGETKWHSDKSDRTDVVPQTPTIIITPSQNTSNWFSSSQNKTGLPRRARASSSVYSRATNYFSNGKTSSNVPPMPQVPAYATRKISEGGQETDRNCRLSVGTIFSEDGDVDSASRERVISTCTTFEEDESPILTRKLPATSNSAVSPTKHNSITALLDQRASKGWWNYITTPFLTRSNTLASPRSTTEEYPALPNLDTAAAKAQWEKSYFSPMTPTTSTTIASSVWWDKRNTITGSSKDVNSPDEEAGTLPFMLAEGDFGASSVQERTEQQQGISGGTMGRGPSTRTQASVVSPSDREAPFVLSDLISNSSAISSQNAIARSGGENLNRTVPTAESRPTNNVMAGEAGHTARSMSETRDVLATPPPPYSPAPARLLQRYRAIFPPGHRNNLREPPSPTPLTPNLRHAMSSRGAIPLSDVPLTPAPRRPINLNSGYPGLPTRPNREVVMAADLYQPSEKASKAEAKRRRHEREDALAHKAGGLWRGRGCISNRGCYGRGGAEGRKRRRCWLSLIAGFLAMIILIIVLAITLHRSPSPVVQPSQWLNITGFPPIYTGLSTIAAPDNTVANPACARPATMWSCTLPKELQQSVAPNQPDQPYYRIEIQWDNSSLANATFANVTGNPSLPIRSLGNNAVSAGQVVRDMILRARQVLTFTTSPPAPKYAEQFFLGNTTDGVVSENKAGEPTPFYISLLATKSTVNVARLLKRDNSTTPVNNRTASIVATYPPDLNIDGTAAPANLLPFPSQQPLRLFDRGLDTEHYGFYTYYNRSIFLKSNASLTNTGASVSLPEDENGGATENEATMRCTWTQTRFLVQIWTRKANTSSLVNATTYSTFLKTTASPNTTANDFSRPGSFPLPVTISIDRHGGDPLLKLVYCYALDNSKKPIISNDSPKQILETRDAGGVAVNAVNAFDMSGTDPTLGGFDGGTGGCGCEWRNWMSVANT